MLHFNGRRKQSFWIYFGIFHKYSSKTTFGQKGWHVREKNLMYCRFEFVQVKIDRVEWRAPLRSTFFNKGFLKETQSLKIFKKAIWHNILNRRERILKMIYDSSKINLHGGKTVGAQDSKFAGFIDMNQLGFKCL